MFLQEFNRGDVVALTSAILFLDLFLCHHAYPPSTSLSHFTPAGLFHTTQRN